MTSQLGPGKPLTFIYSVLIIGNEGNRIYRGCSGRGKTRTFKPADFLSGSGRDPPPGGWVGNMISGMPVKLCVKQGMGWRQ